jgi:hypothetical protein
MYRLKKSALVSQDNNFFYQYRAFNGIVFEVVDELIPTPLEYQDGVILQNYHNEYIPIADNEICIDQSALVGKEDEDCEPFMYQDKEFSGVAYDFDEEFCIAETRYIDGINWAETNWSLTGELTSFSSSFDNIFQAYEWYENGFFESIDICESETHTMELKFTEKQELSSIDISIDYFNNISKFKTRLKFHFLESKSFSKEVKIGSKLFASGLGVDDMVFSELQSCPGFSDLKSITLFGTSVSNICISSLEKYKSLKNISIDDKRNEVMIATKKLKLRRPECFIELNDIEIKA